MVQISLEYAGPLRHSGASPVSMCCMVVDIELFKSSWFLLLTRYEMTNNSSISTPDLHHCVDENQHNPKVRCVTPT